MENKIETILNEARYNGLPTHIVAEQLLDLFSVSQQRELLKKFWKYFDEESVAINCNNEEREEVITNFFNSG
jgi:hypothetical protein